MGTRIACRTGTLALEWLWANVNNGNARSKRLLQRLGFQQAAPLPESDFGGRVADVTVFTREL
ncbi:MAG: hypothetical protein HFE95_06490 [Acutalibacter sp.]|nr:hypothetical protein [Acutalibacter sp.]